MTEEANLDAELDSAAPRSWLYDHIGRISGIALGLIAFFGLAFLAVAGSKSALGLVVIIVFGVFVIAVGGRLRGR